MPFQPTLSALAPTDITAALPTLDPATSKAAVEDAKSCKAPLAWVTLVKWPGSRGGMGWGNAREMRNLLEKVREAQSLRLAADPTADITKIEMVDFEAAGVPWVHMRAPTPPPPRRAHPGRLESSRLFAPLR